MYSKIILNNALKKRKLQHGIIDNFIREHNLNWNLLQHPVLDSAYKIPQN